MTDRDPAYTWTIDEWELLKREGVRWNIPPEKLLRVLGVERLSDYTAGYAAAVEALHAHAVARDYHMNGRLI
jgi:hypothetical protein